MISNFNNTKELKIEFTNWNIDDIVAQLSKYIESGFTLLSWRSGYHLGGLEIEVTLTEARK